MGLLFYIFVAEVPSHKGCILSNQSEADIISGWHIRFKQRYQILKDRKEMTQTRLAEIMEVKQATVSRWLTGEQEPRELSIFIKLASVLGVTLKWLLFAEQGTNAQDGNVEFALSLVAKIEAAPEYHRENILYQINIGPDLPTLPSESNVYIKKEAG